MHGATLRPRPSFRLATTAALALALAPLTAGCHRTAGSLAGSVHTVEVPTQTGGRDSGKRGDLVLRAGDGSSVTIAAAPDLASHRPVRGAIVDVDADENAGTDQDPIASWQPAWFDAAGVAHVLVADAVGAADCGRGQAGVRATGTVDGVQVENTVCVRAEGGYAITTRATGLPPGATLGDVVDAGTAQVSVDRAGRAWSGAARGRFAVIAEPGIALGLEAPEMLVQRDPTPENDELSGQVLFVRYGPRTEVHRTLHVAAGDAFDALAQLGISTRRVALRGRARAFEVQTPTGETLWQGEIPASGMRSLRLPPDFAGSVLFRDERGVPARRMVPLSGAVVTAPVIERTLLRLHFVDQVGLALPTHVIFRGLDATPDPQPRLSGHGFQGGRSVYLLDGTGDVALAPGRYRVTASHGLRYGIAVREVALVAGAEASFDATLPEIVQTPDYIAGDFHLHAAPSPDSHVTLAERVGTLFCEGVDFAVATDHNHVTDYSAAVAQVGAVRALGTMPGEEVTTFAPHWGHFNAFPMTPGSARSSEIVPFFATTPARIFAGARERGARVIEVNHPRLKPAMGYFDFAHFDAATGRADNSFATDFDAVEAFNGWNIEHPELVRASVQDLVGLARRGMHPAATGNSDSHYLLFEEAGYPRTYVLGAREPVEGRRERVMAGLLAGHTTVSAGPLVEVWVNGVGPGDTVRGVRNGRVAVRVLVRAPAWVPVENVEVWVDDKVALRIAVPGPPRDGVRFDETVSVPMPHDGVVLAWADATTPLPEVLPYAHAIGVGFTGLVFVDADADGRVTVAPRE